jgi:LytS/YehU family sensor histidine kinase
LFKINEQVWFLHLYKVRDAVHPPDVKLVTGIASLLGLHFQSRRLEIQAQLLARAEYAALRSQVNPHFLFNTLSAIKLHIRQDPAQAQQLLLALASFFRRTLEMKDEFITLSEEVESVELYLTIQRARFGDRLCVEYDIPRNACPSPYPLSLSSRW